MRRTFQIITSLLVLVLVSACGGGDAEDPLETATPLFTLTPDPCFEANLPAEVSRVHKLTREFDDYATLASSTPQGQLVTVIPELQRVLREAEDQAVPSCLKDLKGFQISHMRVVVQTLLAFIGNADASTVNVGIAKSRELHAQYDLEMARLLGVTLVIPTPAQVTLTAEPTLATPPTATPVPFATNPGPNDLNLRGEPNFNAAAKSVLSVGGSTVALGRTADSQWIQVQVPDQPDETAWVYATVVQLSVPIEALPVTTP